MKNTPRFSFGTNLFDDIAATASSVANCLLWLESRQQAPEGYWGTASMLEKVVSTCHAIMAFQCCGYHYSDEPVAKGIEFLTEGAGATSDWAFWRLGPLLGVDRFVQFTTQDLQDLKMRVLKGAEIHPDQLLATMALKANVISPRLSSDETKRFLDLALREWTEASAWSGRADTTANAISTLEHYDFEGKDMVLSRSVALVKKWAKIKRDRVVWGLNVSTAYVLYSIVESTMWDDPELRDLALRASSGLLLARHNEYWDPEEPPYGGKRDIVNPDYFTAAIIRGVCAVETRRDRNFPLEVQVAIRQKRAQRVRELEREIEKLKQDHGDSIDREVERRLKEKSAALDVRKLALKELFTKLSTGSIAFLCSIIVGTGAIGWSLGKYFTDQARDPATSLNTLSSNKQNEKPGGIAH